MTSEERPKYLETARDIAILAAQVCRRQEHDANTTDYRRLARKRLSLQDTAIDFQRDLILIDARLRELGKPTENDIQKIITLRNKVREAIRNNRTVSAAIDLANAALNALDEVANP